MIRTVNQKEMLVALLIAPITLFYNLRVIVVLGRVFTLSDVLIIISIVILFKRTKLTMNEIIFFFSVISLPVLTLTTSLSKEESIKSVSMLLIYSIYTLLVYARIKSSLAFRKIFINAFEISIFVLSLFLILQFIVVNIFGLRILNIMYPFGRYSRGYHDFYLNYKLAYRPSSLYFEPNLYGMIGIFGLLMLDYSSFKSFFWKMFTIISLLLTFSTTTYSAIVAIGLYYCVSRVFVIFRKLELRRIVLYLLLILCFSLFVIGVGSGWLESIRNTLGRLKEVSDSGTSGYSRIVVPFWISVHVLTELPLGVGLGAHESITLNPPEQLLIRINIKDSGLHNILAVWIVSFGLMSIIYILMVAFVFLKLRKYCSLLIAFSFFLVGTGNFVSAEFSSIVLLLSLAFWSKNNSLSHTSDYAI